MDFLKDWASKPDESDVGGAVGIGAAEAEEIISREAVGDGEDKQKRSSRSLYA